LEYSQENPLCWTAIENFKTHTSYEALKKLEATFLHVGAPFQVNISHRQMEEVAEMMDKFDEKTPLPELQSCLNGTQRAIFQLMEAHSWPQFLANSLYRAYLQNNDLAVSTPSLSSKHISTGSQPTQPEDVELFLNPP